MAEDDPAAGYFAPFRSGLPALLVSGDTDPAVPPRWGEAVHSFLPNSVHVIVPGGLVPISACTDAIADAMFRTGSPKGLDLLSGGFSARAVSIFQG